MELNLIITGVGGQGNVLASQIIGTAAVKKGLKTSVGETFGLSQRGGPVMSHIRISDNKVRGPLIAPNMADIILGIEPLECLRIIEEFGNENTIVISNSRPIHPINVIAGDVVYPETDKIRQILKETCKTVFWLDATDMAIELGNPILLNVIMLGALCGLPKFPVSDVEMIDIISDILPSAKLELNRNAFKKGTSAMLELQ
ncbi:indolepyruvate oxidoreductase subunit beta [bacterium]|nr:indolepyruvate oxidoreductase subunit beta [bacterium]